MICRKINSFRAAVLQDIYKNDSSVQQKHLLHQIFLNKPTNISFSLNRYWSPGVPASRTSTNQSAVGLFSNSQSASSCFWAELNGHHAAGHSSCHGYSRGYSDYHGYTEDTGYYGYTGGSWRDSGCHGYAVGQWFPMTSILCIVQFVMSLIKNSSI